METIKEFIAPANWEATNPQEKLFSEDHLIDAYLKGKNDGFEHAQKLIIEKLQANIFKSDKDASTILTYLLKKGIKPNSVYLKINSWDDFSILFILQQKDFLSPKMIDAYHFVNDLEKKVRDEFYHIHITFCDMDDQLDTDAVLSDGYVLKHKM
jgi:hypothetical protein